MSPNRKTKKLDMLNGPIWNKLPQYAIPVAATRDSGAAVQRIRSVHCRKLCQYRPHGSHCRRRRKQFGDWGHF